MAYNPNILGVVPNLNSTIVNLAAAAIFTGTAEDVTNFSSIKVSIFTSHASALNGLSIQQSLDGTNWDITDVYTVPATTGRTFSVSVNAKFFRVVYTNGATLTTSLRIQTIYHTSHKQTSSQRPQDGRSNDNDFEETLSHLMGYNSLTDAWNRIGITNAVTGGNENLIDRIKVNAALRMIDNAQPSGSKLVNLTGTQALGLDANISDRAARLLGVLSAGANTIGAVNIAAGQTLANVTTVATVTTVSSVTAITNALPAGNNALGNINELRASNLLVTVTAATGVTATLTLPVVAAQFHYITSLDIRLYSTAARTGVAAPIIVTSTNIPGGLAFTFDTAGAIGTSIFQDLVLITPLKSSVVGTATTIVLPAVTGGIWRATATYFAGA